MSEYLTNDKTNQRNNNKNKFRKYQQLGALTSKKYTNAVLADIIYKRKYVVAITSGTDFLFSILFLNVYFYFCLAIPLMFYHNNSLCIFMVIRVSKQQELKCKSKYNKQNPMKKNIISLTFIIKEIEYMHTIFMYTI